jgi:hypothetical protein
MSIHETAYSWSRPTADALSILNVYSDPKKSSLRKVVPVSSRRLVRMQVLACLVPSVDPVDPKPLLIAEVVLF